MSEADPENFEDPGSPGSVAIGRDAHATTRPRPWDSKPVCDEQRRISRPDAEGFAGLAFSGGGIRSATFGLGVLEALKDRGLLERFDYLSSVSGGGYISAWLSANCLRKGRAWLGSGADWSESTQHLRKFSNYLSPQVGFFSADTWSMFMIWIRNAILVQLTVLLGLSVVLLLPRILFMVFLELPGLPLARWVTVCIFIAAIVGVASNLVMLHPDMRDKHSSDRAGRYRFADCGSLFWLIPTAIAAGLAAWIYASSGVALFGNGPVGPIAFPIALFMMITAFCAVPSVLRLKYVCTMAARRAVVACRSSPRGRQFVRRFSALLIRKKLDCATVNYGQSRVQVMVVLPTMLTGYSLSAVLWGLLDKHTAAHGMYAIAGYGELISQGWLYWPLPLAVAFCSFVLLGFCSMCGLKQNREGDWWCLVRTSALALFAAVICMAALHAMFSGIVLLMQMLKAGGRSGPWHAFALGTPLVLMALSISITLQIGLLGKASMEGMREWWSRVAAWLMIYSAGWVLVTFAAIYGPLAAAWLANRDNWHSLSAAGAWLATSAGALFAGNSSKSGGNNNTGARNPTTAGKMINLVAVVGPYVFVAGLLVVVSTALHFVLWKLSDITPDGPWKGVSGFYHNHWKYIAAGGQYVLWALAGCMAAFLVMIYRVDINEFSLNAFYRNRLVRCYLGASRIRERRPQRFTNFDDDDDLPMSMLAWHPPLIVPHCGSLKVPAGPLHIVNCALNLGGSSDLSLHSRHSASFSITPHQIGSCYLSENGAGPGFRSHWHYGASNRQVTLGQAISVSGAAASPNMGYHTSPATALLLTLFNVRLGWWFPNPNKRHVMRSSPKASLRYLLMELFGVADDGLSYLSVSDGGHFENLAVYELIRRKCRLIVVSDAECDQEMKFEGLGTLIRMCKVDFDVDIDIDVSGLKPALDSGYSNTQFAIGTIRYNDPKDPKGIVGVLIYLKASLNGGGEDTSIMQYKSMHAEFPHESTGDQFYGEDQFESYRRLGRQVADAAFGEGIRTAALSGAQRRTLQSVLPAVFGSTAGSQYRAYRTSRGPVASWPIEHPRLKRKRLVLSMVE